MLRQDHDLTQPVDRSPVPVVLCVDDDPSILSALRRSLTEEFYEVVTAQNAAQALASLRKRPIKVVISDERMPEVNGSEFMGEVRDRWPWIGRVILTGYPSHALIGRGFDAGIDFLIHKPWDNLELKNIVRGLILDLERTRFQNGAPSEAPEVLPAPLEEEGGTPSPFRERHVVVLVDDDLQVLAALKRSLRKEPYLVLATQRPQKAIRWVEQIDVSAVVTDQRMDGMTGMELLTKVAANSPVTVRVILTGFPEATVRVPKLGQSIDCVIAKPWDDAMLRKTLREFLAKREAEQETRDGVTDREHSG